MPQMKNSGSCSLFGGGCLGLGFGGGGGGGAGFFAADAAGLFAALTSAGATGRNGGSSARRGYSLALISETGGTEACGEAAACPADCGEAVCGEAAGGGHIALSHAGAALPSKLATHCCIFSAGLPLTRPTTCAGDPATAVRGGTGFSTREPAATCAPLPTVMLPRIVAAAPMRTLSSTLGCLSPASLPVPPSVTFWRMETLSPTTAVSCFWRREREERKKGDEFLFLSSLSLSRDARRRKKKTRKKNISNSLQ